MNKSKRALLQELIARKRVQVTPDNYVRHANSILLLIPTIGIICSASLLFFTRLTFLSLGISIALIFISVFLYLYFRKRIQSTAVKGGTLILNTLDHKNKVTSLRSIKRINTKSAFGVQWTQLSYNLDGKDRSAIIVNKASAVPVLPETTIKKAIALNKKEKANHKPGPVHKF